MEQDDDLKAAGRQEERQVPEERAQEGIRAREQHEEGKLVSGRPYSAGLLRFRSDRLCSSSDL